MAPGNIVNEINAELFWWVSFSHDKLKWILYEWVTIKQSEGGGGNWASSAEPKTEKKSEWFPGLRLQQFECLFTHLIVCTSQKNHISVVGLLTICSGRNHHKNEIIPLKMKNESCVRYKSSDCALLFHYWSFDNDLPVLIFCISIIIFSKLLGSPWCRYFPSWSDLMK